MANVVCTICGDKGHVASDCKKAAEANKRENMDWKAQAEKKAQMDKDFGDMMSDLGGMSGGGGGLVPAGGPRPPMPGAVPGAGAPGSCIDKSIICPGMLVGRLIGPAGATIKKLATESGAQINMDTLQAPGGGKAVIISAADPTVRERAKAAVQEWIKSNSTPGVPGAGLLTGPRPVGLTQPPVGLQPPQQPSSNLRPVAPLNTGGLAPPGGLRPPMGGAPSYGGGGLGGGGGFPQRPSGIQPPGGMGMPPQGGMGGLRPPAYGGMGGAPGDQYMGGCGGRTPSGLLPPGVGGLGLGGKGGSMGMGQQQQQQGYGS